MRCHYISDLHLESQDFQWKLPKGDVLIVAGDLCHARCLDPARRDKYSIDQRARVMRFVESAVANFGHVLLVAGNHDHYDGVFDETIGLLRQYLPGITVLDNDCVDLDGVRFFGSTLWSDFESRSAEAMNGVRRRIGEYFFVKKRSATSDGRHGWPSSSQRTRPMPSTHRVRPCSGGSPPIRPNRRSSSRITRRAGKGSILHSPETVSTGPMRAISTPP